MVTICLALVLGHRPSLSAPADISFAATRMCVMTAPARAPWYLHVELADSAAQREQGLMGRSSLPADAGMLFRYTKPQPPDAGFWMPHVPFPLDIAFLDADGEVKAIRTMPPCPSPERAPCPTYPAGVSFHAALEVNAGALAKHGVRPGRSRVGTCPGAANGNRD
ncbi:DUF192 domain-containing protein [Methylolobus aquaticus]